MRKFLLFFYSVFLSRLNFSFFKKLTGLLFKRLILVLLLVSFVSEVSAQSIESVSIDPVRIDIAPISANFEIVSSVSDSKDLIELINQNQATNFDWKSSKLAKVDINILEAGWKVYYRYPGFIGYEPKLSFVDQDHTPISEVDFKVFWPKPVRSSVFGIEVFAYDQNVEIPIVIQNSSKINFERDKLLVEVYSCKDVCIKKDFFFKLNDFSNFDHSKFLAAIDKVPIAFSDFLQEVNYDQEHFEINIKLNDNYDYQDILISDKKNIFRVRDKNINPPYLKQVMVRESDLNIDTSEKELISSDKNAPIEEEQFKTLPDELIIILDRADKPALMQKIDLTTNALVRSEAAVKSFEPQQNNIIAKLDNSNNQLKYQQKQSLLIILLLAFLGGFILNFMPCVLPVLSMKLLSLVGAGIDGSSNRLIRMQKLSLFANWLGVMMAFFIMALSLALLKFFGSAVGFGLQFQNNYFLAIMIIVLNLFLLNFFNLITFQLQSRINNLIDARVTKTRSKYIEQFFLGFFAVLIATPCSAPFLVTAIGYALSENYFDLMLIFMMLGLGFSSPYILLFFFPNLIKLLPKRGVWQSYLKRTMAFLLILTIAYFIYILSRQQTLFFTIFIVSSLIIINLLLLYLKTYRKYSFQSLVALFIIILFVLPYSTRPDVDIGKFEIDLIEGEIKRGSNVLVNVTADWCLTCKVNEARVFASSDIKEYFIDNDINIITLDWTLADRDISSFLARYNNFSIPFYLYFNESALQKGEIATKAQELLDTGHILPVLLSKKGLIEEIEAIE